MIALQAPLLVALVVVAWLTAGGMAVRSVSRIWLRHWAERRLRGSGAALAYLERPQRLLAAASTGVAATLLFSGMIIGATVSGAPVIGAVLAFTAIVILFGQLIPRAHRAPVARRSCSGGVAGPASGGCDYLALRTARRLDHAAVGTPAVCPCGGGGA